MSFKDRLNYVMQSINCSNANLSRLSDVDASLISRFRKGNRIPSYNSKIIDKLCNGILLFCDKNDSIELLRNICGATNTSDSEYLYTDLYNYITVNSTALKPERQAKKAVTKEKSKRKPLPLSHFGTRLNTLMEIMDISNVRLARQINVDASLISRFRTGIRVPTENSQIIVEICKFFSTRKRSDNQNLCLITALDSPMDFKYINDDEQLFKELMVWLQASDSEKQIKVLDTFLDMLNTYEDNFLLDESNLALVNAPVAKGSITALESYWGLEGMCAATLRFLQSAIAIPSPTTLYIYSDQDMNWLTHNLAFKKKWTALLKHFLDKDNSIYVIHNLDRSPQEMLRAMNAWLPFYASGKLHPFYCKKMNRSKFAHSLFVIPNHIAVSNCSVSDDLKNAEYRYYTDTLHLDYYMQQFDVLLKSCTPLMQAYTTTNISEFSRRLYDYSRKPGHVKMFTSTLAINSMPRQLLNDILVKRHFSKALRNNIIQYYENRQKRYLNNYSEWGITEICTLPTDEMLYGGRVHIDIPEFICSSPIYYTPEEFSMHIENVIELISTHPKYFFVPVYEAPFENLQIGIKDNTEALIVKYSLPCMAFYINHPILCNTLDQYTDYIISKNTIVTSDTISNCKALLRYII